LEIRLLKKGSVTAWASERVGRPGQLGTNSFSKVEEGDGEEGKKKEG